MLSQLKGQQKFLLGKDPQPSKLNQPKKDGNMVELLSQQQQIHLNDISTSSMQQVRFQDFIIAQNTGLVNANDPIHDITNRTTVQEIRKDVFETNNYSPMQNTKILDVQNKNVDQFNNTTSMHSYEQDDSIVSVQDGNPELDSYQKQFANAQSHQFNNESYVNQNLISSNHKTENDGYSTDDSVIAVSQKIQNRIKTKEFSLQQYPANSTQFGNSKKALIDILEDRKSKEYRVQNFDEANKLHQILNGHKDLTETFLGPSKKVQSLKQRVLRAEANKNSSIERDKKLNVMGRKRKTIIQDKLSTSPTNNNMNQYDDHSLENIGKPSKILTHSKANDQIQQIGSRHPLYKQKNWDSGDTFGSEMRKKSQERIEKLTKMVMVAKSKRYHLEQQYPQKPLSKLNNNHQQSHQLAEILQSTNLDRAHTQGESPFLTEGIESQRAIITIRTNFRRSKQGRGDIGVHVTKSMTDQYSDANINKLETDSNMDLQAALNMYDKSGENFTSQPAPYENQIEYKLESPNMDEATGPTLQKESFLLAVVGDQKYVLANNNSSSKIQKQNKSFMLNGVQYGNQTFFKDKHAGKSKFAQVAQTKGASQGMSSRQSSEGLKRQLMDDIGAMQQYGDLALQSKIEREHSNDSEIESNKQNATLAKNFKTNDYGKKIARIEMETPSNEDQADGKLMVSTQRAKSFTSDVPFQEIETPNVVEEEENGMTESDGDSHVKKTRQTMPASPSRQSLAPMSSSSLKSIIVVHKKSNLDSRSVLGKSHDFSIKDLQQNQEINQEIDYAIDQPNEIEEANGPVSDIIEMPDVTITDDHESEIMQNVLQQTHDQRATIEGLFQKDDAQENYLNVESNQKLKQPVSMNKTMGFNLSQKFPQARNINFSSMHKLQNQMKKDDVDEAMLDLRKQEQSEYIQNMGTENNQFIEHDKSINNSIRTELLSGFNINANKNKGQIAGSEYSNDDDSTGKMADNYQREQLNSKNDTKDGGATNELSNFNLQAKIQYKVSPKHAINRSDAQAQASVGLAADQIAQQEQQNSVLEKRISAIKLPTIQNQGDFFPAFDKDIQASEPAFKNLSKLFSEKERSRFYEKNKQIAQNILNQIGDQQSRSPQRRSLSPHINVVTMLDPQADKVSPILNLELTHQQLNRQKFISDKKEPQVQHQQQSSFSLTLRDATTLNNGQQNYNKYHQTMRAMDRNNTYNNLSNDPQNVIRYPQFQMTSFRANVPMSNQGAAPLMSNRQYIEPNLPQVKEESLTKQQRKMNALMNLKKQISLKAEMSSMVHLSEPLLADQQLQSQYQSQTQRQLKESESQLSYRNLRGNQNHNVNHRNHSMQIDNQHQYNSYTSHRRNNSHFGVFNNNKNSVTSSRFSTTQSQPYMEKDRQNTNNHQYLKSERGQNTHNVNPNKTKTQSQFLLQAAKQNLKHLQKQQQSHFKHFPQLQQQQAPNQQHHLQTAPKSSIPLPSQVVVVYNNDYANHITQQSQGATAAVALVDNSQDYNEDDQHVSSARNFTKMQESQYAANITLYPKHMLTNANTESNGQLAHQNRQQHYEADRYEEVGPQMVQNNINHLDHDGNNTISKSYVQPTNISVITTKSTGAAAAIKHKHASRRGNSVDRVIMNKIEGNSYEFDEDSKKRIDTSSDNFNENNGDSNGGGLGDDDDQDQDSPKKIKVGKQQQNSSKALLGRRHLHKQGTKQTTQPQSFVPVNQFPILVVDQQVINATTERQLKSYRQRILNKRNSSQHQLPQPLPKLLVQMD